MHCISHSNLGWGRDLKTEWDHAMWMPNMTLQKILIFSLAGSRDTLWSRKKQNHSFFVGAGRRYTMSLTLNDASEEEAQLLRYASVWK